MTVISPDIIPEEEAGTLGGLFAERIRRTPQSTAYRFFNEENSQWLSHSWRESEKLVGRWQSALAAEGLKKGERVAVLMKNCPQWAFFDIAALSMGLVVVPLYNDDRPDNIAYILKEAGVRLLLIGGEEQWEKVSSMKEELPTLKKVLTLEQVKESLHPLSPRAVGQWLPEEGEHRLVPSLQGDELATIVYTSGTTGKPKGVQLTHKNILSNAAGGLKAVAVYKEDLFLSFLPLSHMLERTAGYYLPMMAGSTVAYARSIPLLPEDLITIKPTILISVPRIYERVYLKLQEQLAAKSPFARKLFHLTVECGWRIFENRQKRGPKPGNAFLWPLLDLLVAGKVKAKLGGQLRFAISGGAPLPPEVARVFIGLGVPILQGYGLTETSPVISVTRMENNRPDSVGLPLEGVRVSFSPEEELLVKGPGITKGYWRNREATELLIDKEGWLHTGDKARIEEGNLVITGRIKEIIVLSNGEKVPPGDLEMAIALDPLIEQVIVIGDNRPYLCAIVVLNEEGAKSLFSSRGLPPDSEANLLDEKVEEIVLKTVGDRIQAFPGYAQVRRVALTTNPWTIENGLLTPTLKLKRPELIKRFQKEIDQLYEGH